ncbi:hypothetical protein P7C70_g9010, partial [Phenoliferia sp. Uapishka_3]
MASTSTKRKRKPTGKSLFTAEPPQKRGPYNCKVCPEIAGTPQLRKDCAHSAAGKKRDAAAAVITVNTTGDLMEPGVPREEVPFPIGLESEGAGNNSSGPNIPDYGKVPVRSAPVHNTHAQHTAVPLVTSEEDQEQSTAGSTTTSHLHPPTTNHPHAVSGIPIDPKILGEESDIMGPRGGTPDVTKGVQARMDRILARAVEVDSEEEAQTESGDEPFVSEASSDESDYLLSGDELEKKRAMKQRMKVKLKKKEYSKKNKGKGRAVPVEKTAQQVKEQEIGEKRRSREKEGKEVWGKLSSATMLWGEIELTVPPADLELADDLLDTIPRFGKKPTEVAARSRFIRDRQWRLVAVFCKKTGMSGMLLLSHIEHGPPGEEDNVTGSQNLRGGGSMDLETAAEDINKAWRKAHVTHRSARLASNAELITKDQKTQRKFREQKKQLAAKDERIADLEARLAKTAQLDEQEEALLDNM